MDRQQVKAAVFAVVLITAPTWISRVWPTKPSAFSAEVMGWDGPEASRHIAIDIFERINDERAARGLHPLVWHDGLADIAGRWSEHMISEGDYRHSDPEFRQHSDVIGTGENIAMLYRGAADVHVGWMESDGHRANILNADYDVVGVGVVCRADGRLWGTQVFGVLDRPPVPRRSADLGPDPLVRGEPGPSCPDGTSLLP